MNAIDDLCEDIAYHQALGDSIRQRIEKHGAILIEEGVQTQSLRDLALRCGCSATYLSLARHCKTQMSASVFLRLAGVVHRGAHPDA
jgi:hypothetical protein